MIEDKQKALNEAIESLAGPDKEFKVVAAPGFRQSLKKAGFDAPDGMEFPDEPVTRWDKIKEFIQYDMVEWIKAPYEWATDVSRGIKWKVQRAQRGYSDNDVWDMHSYLSKVIPGMARQIANEGYCHPTSLKNKEEWDTILTQIAVGFESGEKLYEDWPISSEFSPKLKRLEKEYKLGMKLFKEYYFNLWD